VVRFFLRDSLLLHGYSTQRICTRTMDGSTRFVFSRLNAATGSMTIAENVLRLCSWHRMTIFKHHPLRFSIGRALPVTPGSVMVIGWQTKHLFSLSHYIDKKRTITMDSWIMNRGKSNSPTDDGTVAAWAQVIRDYPNESG
jgi:hypothetical protein